LSNRKTRIRRGLVTGFGHDYEFVLDDLVNGDPAIITRRADHFHELLHSFFGAAAGQSEPANVLKLLTRGFLHSRESNLAQNKPSASRILTFCSQGLLEDDVGKTGIGADGRRVEQRAPIDAVRILAKDFATCCSDPQQSRNVFVAV